MNFSDIIHQAQQISPQIVLPDSEKGKVKLDVSQTINQQIQQQGIHPEQIAIAPYCTYQTPEYFFSYRRTRMKKNQWSGIISC